jgi:hypothetical protein
MADRIARALASDRAFRVAGWLTLSLVLLMLVIARLVIPDISENTEANVRTDELAGCRAFYRAAIDDANFGVTVALGEAQTALSDAVVASIRQDPTTLALIAARLETAEEHKAAAFAVLNDANIAYDEAVDLSREDPSRFLRECKETP